MIQYIAVEVYSTDEILIALLSIHDFEAFLEEDDYIIGYIDKDKFDTVTQEEIISIIKNYTDKYKIYEVENKNWNALWEASFQPVKVDDFCQIRADFHPAIPSIQYDLVINPKMAFGTGHHATTNMMIKTMSAIDFDHRTVFDFGCGTGILAILASKMGASKIDAIDIEHEAYLNTLENADINQVSNIEAYEGDLNVMPIKKYDIILANINRNILIKYAASLTDRLISFGTLLLSGVLVEDRESVIQAFEKHGLQCTKQLDRDNWICLQMEMRS